MVDRSVIFFVCKSLKVFEGYICGVVFVFNCYVIQLLILKDWFFNVWFIIIKGKFCIVDFVFIFYVEVWGVYVMLWMEILVNFDRFIWYLRMKCMIVLDSDIQFLVSRCGEGLQRLELEKCFGFLIFGLEIIVWVCWNFIELNILELEIQNGGYCSWLIILVNIVKLL